jgi:hypothetical protein
MLTAEHPKLLKQNRFGEKNEMTKNSIFLTLAY